MSFMLDEIREQPDVIARLAEAAWANARGFAEEARGHGIEFAVLAARGTSDHAAIYGKYLLEIRNALPVALADCSVFTLYDAELRLERALVVGISQSGEATDVAEYLRRSRECGALTLAITNEPGSTLTQLAHHTMLCGAGKERGVAATKTYTSALAAFYLLSGAVAADSACVDRLHACAELMRGALETEPDIAAKAERYRYMESGAVISRGYNYCTALETALKLAETSYIGVRGYSAADFVHGPVATVHEGFPCVLIAPPGKAHQTTVEMARRLRELRAELLVVSSEDDVLSLATTPIGLNLTTDEELSPLVYVIPGQLLACHLAVTRGYDPDRPRGLTKVTLTR